MYHSTHVHSINSALCLRLDMFKCLSLLSLGPRILDEVLTPLLNDLSSEERSEVALDGLKQVMAVKSKVVLPHLIPQLVKPPANTKALALLSSVAGNKLVTDIPML